MSRLSSPEELVKWAGTRDPRTIAEMLEISVHHLFHVESRLPGLTCYVRNRPSIFINDAYFESLLRKHRDYNEDTLYNDETQVIGHELGHCCRHKDQLKAAPIKEYQIFDVRTAMEVEANQFAAGILIDKEEMIDLLNSQMTILQVASAMRVNVNMLIYRIESLRNEGYKFNGLPYIPKNNFIGGIHGLGSSEWR